MDGDAIMVEFSGSEGGVMGVAIVGSWFAVGNLSQVPSSGSKPSWITLEE